MHPFPAFLSPSLFVTLSLLFSISCAASSYPTLDRHRSAPSDYSSIYEDPFPVAPPKHPASHTYPTAGRCAEVCDAPCSRTLVYLGQEAIDMFTCTRLKPPKAAPFFSTLKGNSFYMALFVLAVIVVGLLLLLTLCFCCSYCCRQASSGQDSSRGSSKQALTANGHDEGEFKEYLNGNPEEVGAVKREREYTRRPRGIGAPHIV